MKGRDNHGTRRHAWFSSASDVLVFSRLHSMTDHLVSCLDDGQGIRESLQLHCLCGPSLLSVRRVRGHCCRRAEVRRAGERVLRADAVLVLACCGSSTSLHKPFVKLASTRPSASSCILICRGQNHTNSHQKEPIAAYSAIKAGSKTLSATRLPRAGT